MSRKIFENLTVASEASRSIWEKLAHPQIVGKLKSDYLFSSQKRTDYWFSAFSRSEYLFQQNATPPLRIKWSSPNCVRKMEVRHLGKTDKQETRAMLAAGQCRQGCGRIQCDIQESTAISRERKWLVHRLPRFISFLLIWFLKQAHESVLD